jgi:hypothetical protein
MIDRVFKNNSFLFLTIFFRISSANKINGGHINKANHCIGVNGAVENIFCNVGE